MREGTGFVQSFEPPEWLVILALVAILTGVLVALRNQRLKVNQDTTNAGSHP